MKIWFKLKSSSIDILTIYARFHALAKTSKIIINKENIDVLNLIEQKKTIHLRHNNIMPHIT